MTKIISKYTNLNKNELKIIISIYLAAALFFLIMFGFSALLLFAAMTVCLIPFYLFLGRFGFEVLELILFSFFLTIGIIPTLVYPLSFIIGSIKISTVLVITGLIITSILIQKKIPKQIKE